MKQAKENVKRLIKTKRLLPLNSFYQGNYKTFKIERFAKLGKSYKSFTFFEKGSIVDVWEGSAYVTGKCRKFCYPILNTKLMIIFFGTQESKFGKNFTKITTTIEILFTKKLFIITYFELHGDTWSSTSLDRVPAF